MKFMDRYGALVCAVAVFAAAGALLPLHADAQQKKARLCPPGRVGVVIFKTQKTTGLRPAIEKPLSKKAGDAERGLEAIADTGRGGCLSCHQIAKILPKADESDPEQAKKYGQHGEIGSPLNSVGGRFTAGELRLIVADPQQAFPDADIAMPAYHRVADTVGVHPSCKGRPILSAQEVEDVIAFLKTLK